jgi:hypothetical protein
MRCPHCSLAMEATAKALDPVSGAHGALKLTLERMPALFCPKGHHAPVDGDFMFWLIQELKERAGKVPGGEEKGMILKKHVCSGCGKELGTKPDHRETFRETLSFEGKFSFAAALDYAMHKCPGCGKAQLRSAKEGVRDVSHAMADVTDAAGFPHSG